MANVQNVSKFDVTVKADSLQDDLFSIYNELFPNVCKEDLEFEELKGGYVNSIQKVSVKRNLNKSVVFRTFGLKLDFAEFNKQLEAITLDNQNKESVDGQDNDRTESQVQTKQSNFDVDSIFNRDTEYEVMSIINRAGLCEPLIAEYNNGILYGFADGVTVYGPLMLTNDFLCEMATKLARFHSIKHAIPNIKFRTHLERMESQMAPIFEQMIGVTNAYIDAHKNQFPYDRFPDLNSLFVLEKHVMTLLQRIGLGEINLCHNDLNQKNLIWDPQNRTISFIDFEMVMNNYAILDIGMLFFCFTGHFLVSFDSTLFPNADYRKRFLRKYLEEKNKLNGIMINNDEFEAYLIKLFHRTNLATILSLLRHLTVTPFIEVNPNFFKNDELVLARSKVDHYCARIGYKIYGLLIEIKDEFVSEAEKYADSISNFNS